VTNSISRSRGGCAPYSLVPNAILLALGYECRCAKLIEYPISYAMNPLNVESFVKALRAVSRRFVARGAEVIGVLDPFWMPARYVDRVPLIVFRRSSCSEGCGPRWILYRVDEGVYLQVFSSITAPSADEVENLSDRVRFLGSKMRVNVVELSVAPRLVGLERVHGLDATLCACVGRECRMVDLQRFLLQIALETNSRYGSREAVVVIGSPDVKLEEVTYIWIPAPSPAYVEVLDAVISDLGASSFRRCRIVVDSKYLDPTCTTPITHFSKVPIKAIVSEVCRDVEVVAM